MRSAAALIYETRFDCLPTQEKLGLHSFTQVPFPNPVANQTLTLVPKAEPVFS